MELRTWTRSVSWPLPLLMVSIAVVALTAWQAHRAVKQHHITAATLLHDYAVFAAWSYRGHVESRLAEGMHQALHPVMHEAPHRGRVPHARVLVEDLDDFREECRCEPDFDVAGFFGFTLGADTLGTARLDWSRAERARVVERLTRRMRESPPGWRAALDVRSGPDPEPLAFATMPHENGDTVLYGFPVDVEDLGRAAGRALDRNAVLPASLTRGMNNRDILALAVATPGAPLFRTDEWPDEQRAVRQTLSPDFGALSVRAFVQPEMADQLIIGGLPRSRLPVLLGLLLLAVALSVVAVEQVRREGALARMRSDFVASVSHELRTPLAQIRLFLETLRLGRFNTEAQRSWSLDNIDRETLRLAHLVENVLRFARSGRDDDGVTAEPLDLVREVEEGVRFFEPLAASRRAVVRTELPTAAPARIHREAFRQILLNLLDNAVKYGPAGQTVRVRLDRADDRVRLLVDDEGPGVPRDERSAIWKPFFRGDRPVTRAAGGSGIGLPVVQEIVERYGGRIAVGDAPGGGARFTVELPRGHVAPAGTETAAAGAAGGDG